MLTNRIIAAISLLFIAFIPVLGYAGVHDGNDLLQKCNNVIKIYEDGIEESDITTTMLVRCKYLQRDDARYNEHYNIL